LPAGFNGVVVGYLWRRILVCSLSFTFLLQNYFVNSVWKLWQNCTEVSFLLLSTSSGLDLPPTHTHTHSTKWDVGCSELKQKVVSTYLSSNQRLWNMETLDILRQPYN
jgi:hypothetical protein